MAGCRTVHPCAKPFVASKDINGVATEMAQQLKELAVNPEEQGL